MSTSSVGVKQSWTSAIATCERGSSTPACRYASSAAATHSGNVVKSYSGSKSPDPSPATTDIPLMKSGLSVYRAASSARTTMAAAAPSATPAQSNTDSFPATAAILQMSSAEVSLRNWARGLRAPLRWFFSAIFATTIRNSSTSTPYFFEYAGRIMEYMAAAVSVRAVPSLGGRLAFVPANPVSLNLSQPRAMAMSYAPLATA